MNVFYNQAKGSRVTKTPSLRKLQDSRATMFWWSAKSGTYRNPNKKRKGS